MSDASGQWTELWRVGKIGFHQAEVHPTLAECWGALHLSPASRVFVPLCGKSLDLLWLRAQGHAVIGVELSDIALQAFCMENGIAARRRPLAEHDLYEASDLYLHRGDVFRLTPGMLGHVDAVYDRAALIALPPDLRQQYVDQMMALTGPHTSTLLITLEYDQDQMAGPPFSVDAQEIRRLYPPSHEIDELTRRDILSSEPRFRARGLSRLSEVCYRMIQR